MENCSLLKTGAATQRDDAEELVKYDDVIHKVRAVSHHTAYTVI